MAARNTVLATGAFDILHLGHLRFLEESKKHGGPRARLVVVVARDKTVLHRKGRKPVMPEAQRRTLVAALRPVDSAILGREEVDFLGILRKVNPNIVCVGYDQNDIKQAVKRVISAEKLPIRVVQIRKFGQIGLDSSTGVKERVAKDWLRKASLSG